MGATTTGTGPVAAGPGARSGRSRAHGGDGALNGASGGRGGRAALSGARCSQLIRASAWRR